MAKNNKNNLQGFSEIDSYHTIKNDSNGPYKYFQMGQVDPSDMSHKYMVRIYEADDIVPKFNFWGDYMQRREALCFTAVNNLLRQINFLELNQSLLQEEISDEEFDKEIELNSDKYVIPLNPINDNDDFDIIEFFLHNIDPNIKDFTVNEAAELFSLDPNSMIHQISRESNSQLNP
ncbi:MAG: hypothetical protein KDC73_05745 [Ignavibacteriae bacterium]|nr:hypothetical protein [Ignavibacteriota bacterium]MCB9243771.1 hypothetical protein [Ignavibacteriales bacterium]